MKYRLKNPFIYLAIVSLFILAFVSWIVGAELIKIPFSYGADVDVSYSEYVRFMFDSMLTWEFYIDSTMRYLSLIFPVFSGVAIVSLYEEIHSSFIMSLSRIKNVKKELLKLSLFYAIIGGGVTVFPLIILTTLVSPLLVPSLEEIGELSEIFPSGFYYNHPYLVFIFMICVLYLLLAISYSIMSVGVALIAKRKIIICLVPFTVYLIENILASIAGGILPLSTIDVVTSFNTLRTISSLLIPIGVNYVLALVVFVLCFYFRDKQEVIE